MILVLFLLSLLTANVIRQRMSARSNLAIEERISSGMELSLAAQDAALAALRLISREKDEGERGTEDLISSSFENHLPDGTVTLVTILDENRFFDLNLLSGPAALKSPRLMREILFETLAAAGISDANRRADAIFNRFNLEKVRKTDTENTRPLMNSPAELADILSTTLSKSEISKYLAVIPNFEPGGFGVNVNTADPFLLTCILGRENKQLIDYLCRIREKKPITSLSILDGLGDQPDIGTIKTLLTTESRVFSITSTAQRNDRTGEIHVLAKKSGNEPLEILRWIRR